MSDERNDTTVDPSWRGRSGMDQTDPHILLWNETASDLQYAGDLQTKHLQYVWSLGEIGQSQSIIDAYTRSLRYLRLIDL